MGLQVIGAGFGRTGTMSLKFALEKLGFGPCYHMIEVKNHHEHIASWRAAHRGQVVDWNTVFANYKATVDWPSANHWRELAAFYPSAKVVLTTRDSIRWHESVMRTIYPTSRGFLTSDDPDRRERGKWVDEIIWQGVFSGRFENQAHAIGIFNRHVQSVIDAIPSDRLLILDGKYDWKPLCEFLDCPIPDEAYPVANTSEEFLAGGGAAPSNKSKTTH